MVLRPCHTLCYAAYCRGIGRSQPPNRFNRLGRYLLRRCILKPISASFSRPATINQQVRSCHYGRGVGREINRGTHYVRYLTHPTQFELVHQPFYAAGVGKGGFCQRRAYECRTDHVDADAVTAPFNRHRFCKTFNCMSSTAIDRAINPPRRGPFGWKC